ncbi:MAG: serine hydrolase domain-containing protein [Bryobacteraceae bacterium]
MISDRTVNASLLMLFALQTAWGQGSIATARLDAVEQHLKSDSEQARIAGAVWLVAHDGKILRHGAAGYRNIGNKAPMRPDSIFRIASMTKPVTVTALMILVERGRLSLDDPVVTHLPDFKGSVVKGSAAGETEKALRAITVFDLLTHSSGLPNLPPEPYRDLWWKRDHTLAEAAAVYASLPLEYQPGTSSIYSNPGMALVGRLVEVISGQPYETFVETEILRPLRMSETFYRLPPSMNDRLASMHARGPAGVTPDESREGSTSAKYPSPEGGLFSTATDMFRFYQAMLNGGNLDGVRILSRASAQAMVEARSAQAEKESAIGIRYGLGWWVTSGRRGRYAMLPENTFGHDGGYGTTGWVIPQARLVGILMVQGGADERAIFRNMLAAAIQ